MTWFSMFCHVGLTEVRRESGIGKALNVAHVLGGSIEHDGVEVRVSAELVSAVTGRQLWSAHYDDNFKNIFAVQDRITGAIADTLKVKFSGMRAAPTLNPHAHEVYLKGLAAVDLQTAAGAQHARQYFQQALALDPAYADAWAALGTAYIQLMQYSTLPLKVAASKIRAAADKALALEPQNANALVAMGLANAAGGDSTQAIKDFQRALTLDPNNVRAHLNYGLVLHSVQEDIAQTLEAARLDPDNVTAQGNLAAGYWDLSDWPRMAAAAQAMIRLSPHNVIGAFYLAVAYAEMGRGEDAIKAFDLAQPVTDPDRQLLDAAKLTYQAVLQSSLRPQALAALEQLRRTDLSPNAQGSVIQLYLAFGAKDTVLTMLPGTCMAEPWFCNDLGISPEYRILRGDPRFEVLARQYTTMTLAAVPASSQSR